jgi:hypothetical protein
MIVTAWYVMACHDMPCHCACHVHTCCHVHVQELEALQQGMRHLQDRVGQQDGVIKQHERRLLEVVQVGILSTVCSSVDTHMLDSLARFPVSTAVSTAEPCKHPSVLHLSQCHGLTKLVLYTACVRHHQ